jgi:hypothetical protein
MSEADPRNLNDTAQKHRSVGFKMPSRNLASFAPDNALVTGASQAKKRFVGCAGTLGVSSCL